jgi:hypothetical protein
MNLDAAVLARVQFAFTVTVALNKSQAPAKCCRGARRFPPFRAI